MKDIINQYGSVIIQAAGIMIIVAIIVTDIIGGGLLSQLVYKLIGNAI